MKSEIEKASADEAQRRSNLTYRVGGRNILKNPPQDCTTQFDQAEFERRLRYLMEEAGIREITAKLTG